MLAAVNRFLGIAVVAAISSVVAFAIFAQPTSQGLFGGTIVIVAISGDELVLAADSRNGSDPPDDAACKVVALEPDVIFSAAGRSGEGNPAHPIWSVIGEARRAHDSVRNTSVPEKSISMEMGALWANAVALDLKAAIVRDPKILENMFDDGLVVGVFGRRRKDASLELTTVTLKYDRISSKPSDPVISEKVDSGAVNPEAATPQFWAYGDTAILEEIEAGKTERAKNELCERKRILASKEGFPVEAEAVRSAEVVVSFSLDGKVGGRVDAVSLRRTGIYWVKRKPSCPPD